MLAKLWAPLFWLTVAALGAGALVMAWRHPPRLPASTVADAPEVVAVPPLQPFDPPSLNRYAAITARPVFIDTRRPEEDEPVVEAPVEAPAEPEQPLELVGVLMIPGAAAALLRPVEPEVPVQSRGRRRGRRPAPPPAKPSGNDKVLRVAQGERVEGFEVWRLQSVRADRVVLRKNNGEVRELILVRPSAPPQLPPPANAAQPGATPGQSTPPQAGPGGAQTAPPAVRPIPRS
ncbi:MAG: hypothetical protein KDI50_00855 [Candidatus Competibacteraceae bacterium]|nr:hypothetical protein [Candidatus Competibacteraceae bacterium]